MIRVELTQRNTESIQQIYSALAIGCENIKRNCERDRIEYWKSRGLKAEHVYIDAIGYSHSCDDCPRKQACRDLHRARAYCWDKFCERIREK